MSEDLERRAARHESASLWDGAPPYCVACSFEEGETLPDDVPWPCLVHELAAALAAEQAQLAAAQTRITALERVAEAARACSDETAIPDWVWEQRIADCQSALAALDADA